MRWNRPRADEEEFSGMEVSHLLVSGQAGHAHHPWDWDDETAQELADELEAQLAKKRPPGFAPWPEGG